MRSVFIASPRLPAIAPEHGTTKRSGRGAGIVSFVWFHDGFYRNAKFSEIEHIARPKGRWVRIRCCAFWPGVGQLGRCPTQTALEFKRAGLFAQLERYLDFHFAKSFLDGCQRGIWKIFRLPSARASFATAWALLNSHRSMSGVLTAKPHLSFVAPSDSALADADRARKFASVHHCIKTTAAQASCRFNGGSA